MQPRGAVVDTRAMRTDDETGNGQRATGNARPLTGNGQRATGNGQRSAPDLRVGGDIAARLLDLAAAVMAIVKTLPKDVSGRHIASQLIRSATAGGANYEEARAAESPSDFIHKLGIAAKELRETIFWLRLVDRSTLTTAALRPAAQEAAELCAILTASARTARKRLEEAR